MQVVETAWPREGESLLDAVKRVKKTVEKEALCNVAVSGVINKWDETTKVYYSPSMIRTRKQRLF